MGKPMPRAKRFGVGKQKRRAEFEAQLLKHGGIRGLAKAQGVTRAWIQFKASSLGIRRAGLKRLKQKALEERKKTPLYKAGKFLASAAVSGALLKHRGNVSAAERELGTSDTTFRRLAKTLNISTEKFHKLAKEQDKKQVEELLAKHGGNILSASKSAGKHYAPFYNRLKRLGIDAEIFRKAFRKEHLKKSRSGLGAAIAKAAIEQALIRSKGNRKEAAKLLRISRYKLDTLIKNLNVGKSFVRRGGRP